MKRFLIFVLALALCLPCIGGGNVNTEAVTSANVYTIVTNPGENSSTQMNISWHADYTFTKCYVEYTKATDTAFALSKVVSGTYNTEDYLWFFQRNYGKTGIGYNTTKFLNYGAVISGLAPNTKYIYRIGDGQGYYSDVYTFKTAGAKNFSIMWTSDMHMTNYEAAKLTRFNATTDYLESIAGYEIGMHYNTGDATNCGDRYGFWQTLYSAPVFKKYAYAATIGNHDVFDAMMDDDTNYTQYWKTGKYFGITNYNPQNGFTQTSARISGYLSGNGYSSYANRSSDELILVSDGALAGKYISGAKENLNGRSYWFNYGGVLFIVFDYYAMTAASERTEAFKWAKSVIDANYGKYDYLIASEHINIFNGDSGTPRNISSTSTTTYYDYYRDFCDTNNVDFFLAGDNHIYFRSGPIYNGATTTEANKGTYFLQAPAITNTSSYIYQTGPAGLGLNKYSNASYMGGCVLDVTPESITLKAAMSADGTAENYALLETVTFAKKERYREPDITELTLNADSELKLGENVGGVQLEMTVSQLKAQFVNEDLKVTDAKGIVVAEDAAVGTGYVVSYYIGDSVVDSREIVVLGDTNGDAQFSASDYLSVMQTVNGTLLLEGVYSLAGDISGNASIDSVDYITMGSRLNGAINEWVGIR